MELIVGCWAALKMSLLFPFFTRLCCGCGLMKCAPQIMRARLEQHEKVVTFILAHDFHDVVQVFVD